jgi:hypothetical protein
VSFRMPGTEPLDVTGRIVRIFWNEMKRYFKLRWESPLGPGVIYHEFDGDTPTRQVELYGDRWFSSRHDYHAGLGPGLVDKDLSELALGPEHAITGDEFERVWQESGSSQ